MITLTRYEIAMAALTDEANRRMRAAGRTSWSREDYDAGIDAFNRIMGQPGEHDPQEPMTLRAAS